MAAITLERLEELLEAAHNSREKAVVQVEQYNAAIQLLNMLIDEAEKQQLPEMEFQD